MADLGNDDEWELVNDSGFVYKRKKRPRLDSTVPPPPPDPAVEEKNRRERKKRALIKLKERYLNEIHKWEHLSNTLEDMRQKAQNQQQDEPSPSIHQAPVVSSDSTSGRILDDLLAQAEAHEAIIRDASYLCDVAESLSNAQEERVYQSFIDLPIWTSSPHDLIASLCDD
ncbi:hypothetical protein LguiB_008740 [Lonicera macranthoides]